MTLTSAQRIGIWDNFPDAKKEAEARQAQRKDWVCVVEKRQRGFAIVERHITDQMAREKQELARARDYLRGYGCYTVEEAISGNERT